MTETEFKEKARRLIFDSELRNFPVVFELYARSFKLDTDRDEAMAKVLSIIRTSADFQVAYTMVCHYLDSLEN